MQFSRTSATPRAGLVDDVRGKEFLRNSPRDSKTYLRPATARMADETSILLVERDPALAGKLATYLNDYRYRVETISSANEIDDQLARRFFELVVLDIRTVGRDYPMICQRLARPGGPAIVVTTSSLSTEDRILSLECGADDVMAKPYTLREASARFKALLRRRLGAPVADFDATTYSVCGCAFDTVRRNLKTNRGTVLLSAGEAAVLKALAKRAPQAVSRKELFDEIDCESASGRGVDLLISRLRRKLETGGLGSVVQTHRGLGYMLSGPVMVLR